MLTQVFHLHALSALHVGIGQSVGHVDQPIARAKATNLPLVPGSALKGVLRDEFAPHPSVLTLFGPASINGSDSGHAGALAFGDAHLLVLPVRSLAGVVAFTTCPFLLSRYREDCRQSRHTSQADYPDLPAVPAVAPGSALVHPSSVLRARSDAGSLIVLEDIDLTAPAQTELPWGDALARQLHRDAEWQKHFTEHFAILSDDDFSFLADTATEIRTRIRIDDARGVVADGALWTEENLPAETVLWGIVAAGPGRERGKPMTAKDVHQTFTQALCQGKTLQIGGKATVGRGLVRYIL